MILSSITRQNSKVKCTRVRINTFATPKTMYVSEDGLLKTSGLAMTYRMFLVSFIVTLEIPSTGCSPKISTKFPLDTVTRISQSIYMKVIIWHNKDFYWFKRREVCVRAAASSLHLRYFNHLHVSLGLPLA